MRAVRSCGTQMWTSVSVSFSRMRPPVLPVSAITVMSLARAASTAASTFAELPLVVKASSTSPGRAERLHLLREDHVEAVVVADRGQDRGVGGQCDRRQPGALAFEAADELGGEMLGIASRAAVAAGQHLAAAGDAADQGADRIGDRLAEDLCRRVLEVGAVEELLLDTLFEHDHE